MQRQLARVMVLPGLLFLSQVAHAEAVPSDTIRESANKAVRLMESSMTQVSEHAPCVSCHHGMLPLWTLRVARDHGVAVNDVIQKRVAVKSFSGLLNVDAAIQGTHVVDENLDVSELLAFGPEMGVAPSITTALHARRLLHLQQADGHWKTMDARPPQSFSHFMVTALVAKTVAAYLPDSVAVKAESLAKARTWLAANQPVSTEDATYQVLGLTWLGAEAAQVRAAAQDLAARQKADGGWSATPERASDVYATGEALFALRKTGNIDDAAYQKGAAYLVQSQNADGSWLVKTRLHEVAHVNPPKMPTGFPGGDDQIMSMFGTTWAVAALSLGLPEEKLAVTALNEVRPEAPAWVQTVAFGSDEEVRKVDVKAKTAKGSTPLMVAVADPARAALLIERGADVKAVAQSGHTALSVAAGYRGTAGLIREFHNAGLSAKLGPKTEFHANPLVETAWTGDADVARALLEAGADVKQTMLREGFIPMSPLRAAVLLDSPDVLKELLHAGGDPNTVDEVPLLSWAAISNRPAVARVLLDAGANPELKDMYGWTPVKHARGIDHDVNLTERLIQAAAEKKLSAVR